jgi:hypothetical protein
MGQSPNLYILLLNEKNKKENIFTIFKDLIENSNRDRHCFKLKVRWLKLRVFKLNLG